MTDGNGVNCMGMSMGINAVMLGAKYSILLFSVAVICVEIIYDNKYDELAGRWFLFWTKLDWFAFTNTKKKIFSSLRLEDNCDSNKFIFEAHQKSAPRNENEGIKCH